MNPQLEQRIQRVQDATKSALGRRMADREKSIIDRLVMAYRSGKVKSEDLYGGIAAIAELRSIASEVDRDMMRATDDSEHFQAGASNG